MFKILAVVVSLSLSLPMQASAAESPPPVSSEESFWKRRLENIKSPFTTDAKYILATGTVLTGLLLINEDQWIDETAAEITEHRVMSRFWSKTADNYGKLYPNVAYFAGMYTYGYFAEDALAKKRAWMMLEASLYSGLTAMVLKDTVRQPRPPPTKTKDSFPSGHTTSAFTFASMIQAEHGWYWGTVAYAGALLTAYQRQHNNKHYIHDVVAGATIGAAFGYGVSYANHGNTNLSVMAVPISDGAWGKISWDF